MIFVIAYWFLFFLFNRDVKINSVGVKVLLKLLNGETDPQTNGWTSCNVLPVSVCIQRIAIGPKRSRKVKLGNMTSAHTFYPSVEPFLSANSDHFSHI